RIPPQNSDRVSGGVLAGNAPPLDRCDDRVWRCHNAGPGVIGPVIPTNVCMIPWTPLVIWTNHCGICRNGAGMRWNPRAQYKCLRDLDKSRVMGPEGCGPSYKCLR